MRVLVCGGRYYKNRDQLFMVLDDIHAQTPISAVIDGGARGADWLASSWALERKVPSQTFPADWARHGRSAGAIRNNQMLKEGRPDLVVAFPGGSGTSDMIRRSKANGVPVKEIT